MNPNEIAIHKVKGNGIGVIVDLFREPVCQPSEAAHVHPHRKILAFNERSAYMLRVGVPTDDFHIATDANCRRVPRLSLAGRAVNLLELGIVAIHTERTFHGFEVGFVAVGRDLDSALDAAGAILHKVHGPIRPASADEITDDQFGLRVNSDPSPNIAPSDFFLLDANVFGFCADVCPYLVTLKASDCKVSDTLVVVFHARLAQVNEELGDSVSRHTSHPRCCPNAVAFDQSTNYPDSFVSAKRVHIEHYA